MEFQPKFAENNIEKPKFLYHGTTKKNIESMIPKIKSFEGVEKEFVFASPDKKAAIAYLAKGKYSWSAGIYNDEYFIVLPISKDEFKKNDQGGALYVFDSKNFTSSNDRRDYEWVSEKEEKPIEKELFDSVLEVIENANIIIFFLDSEVNYQKYLFKKQIDQMSAHEFLGSFRK